jgi:hypothetical protein
LYRFEGFRGKNAFPPRLDMPQIKPNVIQFLHLQGMTMPRDCLTAAYVMKVMAIQ